MSTSKIRTTKNYSIFRRSDDNRPTDLKKHRKLEESMKKYGFLRCFPVVVVRDQAGGLVVKDGQHRLQIASNLALPVHYVEEDVDFDVAVINCTPKGWTLHDYAAKHASNGKEAYQQGIDFARDHGVPVGIAFALLAGTVSFNNCQEAYLSGDFEVKDRAWAESVVAVYVGVTRISPALRKRPLLEACMAVCRVKGFDGKRLLLNVSRKPELLKNYGTREGFLQMLEDVYNHHAKPSGVFALKIEALKAMKARNIAAQNAKKKAG